MNKAESKFANMAKRMDDALLRLLEDKPFDSITVTDICRCAGAHRSTFYSHYSNTLELLEEVKDRTLDEFSAQFDHLPKNDPLHDREYLMVYLTFVEEHESLFRVFLKNISLFDGLGMLERLEEDMPNPPSEKMLDAASSRYRTLFMATGITSIVSFWLESGCGESKEELADIISGCIG